MTETKICDLFASDIRAVGENTAMVEPEARQEIVNRHVHSVVDKIRLQMKKNLDIWCKYFDALYDEADKSNTGKVLVLERIPPARQFTKTVCAEAHQDISKLAVVSERLTIRIEKLISRYYDDKGTANLNNLQTLEDIC